MQHNNAITATRFFVHADHCRIGPKGPTIAQVQLANITDAEHDMRGTTMENGSIAKSKSVPRVLEKL
jgi:hypothetical protein